MPASFEGNKDQRNPFRVNKADQPKTVRYDGELQMFVQATREPDIGRLRFLRWLAENDRLEHSIAGPSSGDFTLVANTFQAELPIAS